MSNIIFVENDIFDKIEQRLSPSIRAEQSIKSYKKISVGKAGIRVWQGITLYDADKNPIYIARGGKAAEQEYNDDKAND